ncbi:hypothetical protein [Actinomadura nitritigenes]|uniref:hypothetical protein n=1 Tax=Actinomadura nitritigenes TaxID=134602 RepID=UPI003D8F91CE
MPTTIRIRTIPEYRVPGMPLGRHVRHDSRSRRYPVTAAPLGSLRSVRHTRYIPILDQGQIGSCTGNAMEGALGSGDFFAAIPLTNKARPVLNDATADEHQAVDLYSAATRLDSYRGVYPPTDTGSDGLSVCKAAQRAGLISGYEHALSLEAALTALAKNPILLGINWYDSFDVPGDDGGIAITSAADVRGGHELVCTELDVENKRAWMDNSWTEDYGIRGRVWASWDTLGRLLDEEGDATAPVPLSAPAPTPTPGPDDPDGLLAEFAALVHQAEALGEKAWTDIRSWLKAHGL